MRTTGTSRVARDAGRRQARSEWARRERALVPAIEPPLAVCSPLPRLLKVPEAAAILRLSSRQVWRMIKDGRLSVTRFGRTVRIRSEVLEELMK
jgi:excisionase family DNA binding protein